MPINVWIDVEDLFEFAAYNPRPSGIQRMAFEICCAIQQLEGSGGRINFIRHDQVNFTFVTVSWSSVEALFTHLAQGVPLPHTHPARATMSGTQGPHSESALRRTARKAAYRMPLELRRRVFTTARLQATALRALTDLASFTLRGAIRQATNLPQRLRQRLNAGSISPRSTLPQTVVGGSINRQFTRDAQPGDIILLLGAPWSSPSYAQMIEAARAEFGIEFAVLVYDLIPIRRPEWCDRGLVRLFRQWFDNTLPVSDHIFTISHATKADLVGYLQDSKISTRATDIKVIPVGTSFGDKTEPANAPLPAGETAARPELPEPGTYVLFVSTIEARKNHILLFRVWRRLMETMPDEQIPTLVFAGRVGWLVADLMQQLDNTDWLDGKIRLIEAPADQDIAALYRGCMFTLFPSLYEGWGLPVTESLANGKPCIASSSTSMPEAGGKLARYFDPDSVTDAYRVLRDAIANKEALAAWQAEVARSFKPVSWTQSAACILDTLGATTSCPTSVRPKVPIV